MGTSKYDENLAKYIPGMLELAFQGMIERTPLTKIWNSSIFKFY